MKYMLSIPALILLVYLLANLIVPITFRGEAIFIANAVLWAIVLVTTLVMSKLFSSSMWRTDRTVLQLAAIVATFQIFLTAFMGFFLGFGKNPNVWTPTTLAIYLPYLLMPFLAIELSRAYLTTTIPKHKPTLILLLISLFFTLILSTTSTYLKLTAPLPIAEFLIKTFIPNLAISLLATYLAYLAGAPANITYMAIPTLFTWVSPLLPSLTWQTSSILTVVATTTGFLVLDQAVKPITPKKLRRTLPKKKSQLPYWTGITLIAVIMVWASSGLLGFTPTIIASGSMQPTLNPGDIAIVVATPAETIKTGDIIQYRPGPNEPPVIHRVIDKYESGGTTWFITQGDANNAPDNPINKQQVMGKAVMTIPKLGWVSIALKDFASSAYTFFTTTLPTTLTDIGSTLAKNSLTITALLSLTSYSLLLFTYRNHEKEKKT